jgi:hypothetical protein
MQDELAAVQINSVQIKSVQIDAHGGRARQQERALDGMDECGWTGQFQHAAAMAPVRLALDGRDRTRHGLCAVGVGNWIAGSG